MTGGTESSGRSTGGLLQRGAAFVAIVAGVALLVYGLRHTLSCFMLSYVGAYLLDPVVVWLERRARQRVSAIVVLYLILAAFSFFCIAFLVPFLTLRWESFLRELPLYVQKVRTMVTTWRDTEPIYGAEEWRWLFDRAMENLDKVINHFGAGVYATATRLVFNIFNLILSPILIFFMLYYKTDIIRWTVSLLPAARRETVVDFGRELNRSMARFIRGQVIISSIVAILVCGALLLLGIDYPLFNGLYAGLVSVLPFIGVILAAIPPLFLALVKFQSCVMMAKVAAAFAVIYFVEGYLIKPLVFKESMDLNPLGTILMVMALGELMGLWGVLLAIPVAASLKILSVRLRKTYSVPA